ncbi:hypothetical protein Bca4012_010920 [Brassica carinata]
MSALQSSFTYLSISSNSSFLGQRLLSPIPLSVASPVKLVKNPCLVFAKLKRWERKKCKPNSLPILHKMHVKFGDTVKVISGRDKGKIGEVTKSISNDVNLKTKHMKSREEGEPGQIIKIEAPIHSSNVMLYSKEKDVKWKQLKEAKAKENTQVAAASAS